MITDLQYDFKRLNEFVSGLTGALLSADSDRDKVLKVETGQMAGRIGDAVGPKSKEAAQKKVVWEMKRHLSTAPEYSTFEDPERQGYSKTADFTWLTAGPNWLLGINDEDNQVKATGADAMAMLRAGQKATDRGNAYVQIGTRNAKGGRHQRILRLNRIRISKTAFRDVRNQIMAKTGELRAAFYAAALAYIPTKRIPGWILDKIPQVEASGKSRLIDSLSAGPQAFIELTVRAPGVQSNDGLVDKIQNAIKQSQYSIRAKMEKILRGYKYDLENGRVFKEKGDEISLDA